MTSVRLVADDLTGALDTGAALLGLAGRLPAYWADVIPSELPPSAVLDGGTRELDRAEAVARASVLASSLAGADIAYRKVDSLLRGHALAEVAATFRSGAWAHGVFAPAFPAQGRVTRGGRQFALGEGGLWSAVSGDLPAALRLEGVPASLVRPDGDLPAGIGVFDAGDDEDLGRVVETALWCGGPVLWCGSGGLAGALARGADPSPLPALRPPILGVFGSDQPATERQLDACGPWRTRLAAGGREGTLRVAARLEADGAALVSFELPDGLSRDAAAAAIRAAIEPLVAYLPAPGTLVVAGGETLRAVCETLGARRLDLIGSVTPGVPRSVLCGGRWDGVEIVSKSGAFGRPHLLLDLLRSAGIAARRNES